MGETVNIISLATAARIGFMLLLAQGLVVEAAEVKVLCSSAIVPIMNELVPQFERDTGHKLAMRYGTGPVMKRQIAGGEAFDVAILSLDVDALIKQGKVAPGSRAVLGHTGIGVGARQGAPKSDVSTPDALKRTLLNSKSVAYSREGTSGVLFLGLLERLGLAEEMKSKLKPQPGGVGAKPVVTGEAELVVAGVAPILMTHGAELVGWLPSELQTIVVFTGGIGSAANEAEAGKALLDFLTTPAAASVFKANGLEPGAR
jgi:molybdate transport system substrate-binding protein